MSESFSQKLNDLDVEMKIKKQEIVNEYCDALQKKINELNSEIDKLNEQIKPLVTKRDLLVRRKSVHEKEMKSICNHELIDFRCFDGHSTYSHYECKICKASLHQKDNFKVVERVQYY